jgi:HAE1 family hydrophobic/amphiphilic exporter-1/multidrug efflux pump
LEKAINSIDGIRNLPVLRVSGSSITVEFNLDKDLEEAANDVRDKVSQAIQAYRKILMRLLLFLRLMPIVML